MKPANSTICPRSECPDCRDFELSFSARDNGKSAPRGHRFEVFDAECETVCYCPTIAIAEAVAKALNTSPDVDGYDLLVHCCAAHREAWESSVRASRGE